MLYLRLLVATIRRFMSSRGDLLLENLALRQQPAIYQRRANRPQLTDRDRRFWSVLARSWFG